MRAKKGLVKFKSIRAEPSEWELHILISKDIAVADVMHKKYGASKEYYQDDLDGKVGCCMTISSTKDSEQKGKTVVVIYIREKSPNIIVHELIHAMWHLTDRIGYEMSYHSQEWQAILFEHLYKEAMADDYEIL